jgi:hypothetical protein
VLRIGKGSNVQLERFALRVDQEAVPAPGKSCFLEELLGAPKVERVFRDRAVDRGVVVRQR